MNPQYEFGICDSLVHGMDAQNIFFRFDKSNQRFVDEYSKEYGGWERKKKLKGEKMKKGNGIFVRSEEYTL